jgi:hypothetical protein
MSNLFFMNPEDEEKEQEGTEETAEESGEEKTDGE